MVAPRLDMPAVGPDVMVAVRFAVVAATPDVVLDR